MRKTWRVAFVLAVMAWCGGVHAQTQPPPARPALRFALGQSWASPLIELQAGRPVGGLMFELMEAIAQAAGAEARYVALPSKRVDLALAGGEVDLHCLVSPDWLAQPLPAERWGPPMVELEDVVAVLVARAASAPADLAAQRGLSVGTVLGYSYPALQAAFDAGRLRREDAVNQTQTLAKLAGGRTDVAVVDRMVMVEFNRSQPPAARLVVAQSLSRAVTHCLLAPNTAMPAAQIQAALRRVAEGGELRRLLARYR
jgi:polar amino acid transport system substrate-binding protein